MDFLPKHGCVKIELGNSLALQWSGLGAFTDEVWVRSLARELRSHKPCGQK